MPQLLLLFLAAIIIDWLWQLKRLQRHHQLIAVNRVMGAIPGLGNLYLRCYLYFDWPVPGTGSPEL